jgi:hypothetical protein
MAHPPHHDNGRCLNKDTKHHNPIIATLVQYLFSTSHPPLPLKKLLIVGLLKTDVPPYQDGISKAAFPAFALAAEASFGAQAAVAAPGLRSRSYFGGVGSAQAGHQFSVLTELKYAPRANNGRPLRDAASNTAAFPSAKLRACFFEPPRCLRYPTCPWAYLPWKK